MTRSPHPVVITTHTAGKPKAKRSVELCIHIHGWRQVGTNTPQQLSTKYDITVTHQSSQGETAAAAAATAARRMRKTRAAGRTNHTTYDFSFPSTGSKRQVFPVQLTSASVGSMYLPTNALRSTDTAQSVAINKVHSIKFLSELGACSNLARHIAAEPPSSSAGTEQMNEIYTTPSVCCITANVQLRRSVYPTCIHKHVTLPLFRDVIASTNRVHRVKNRRTVVTPSQRRCFNVHAVASQWKEHLKKRTIY